MQITDVQLLRGIKCEFTHSETCTLLGKIGNTALVVAFIVQLALTPTQALSFAISAWYWRNIIKDKNATSGGKGVNIWIFFTGSISDVRRRNHGTGASPC